MKAHGFEVGGSRSSKQRSSGQAAPKCSVRRGPGRMEGELGSAKGPCLRLEHRHQCSVLVPPPKIFVYYVLFGLILNRFFLIIPMEKVETEGKGKEEESPLTHEKYLIYKDNTIQKKPLI